MIAVYGTSVLSKYINNPLKFQQVIQRIKHLIKNFNIYPASILLLFLVIFSNQIWNFAFYPEGVFLGLVGLRFIPDCLAFPYIIINNALEKQLALAKITFLINAISLGVLFALVFFNLLDFYLYGFILFVVATMRFLLIRMEVKRSQHYKNY